MIKLKCLMNFEQFLALTVTS